MIYVSPAPPPPNPTDRPRDALANPRAQAGRGCLSVSLSLTPTRAPSAQPQRNGGPTVTVDARSSRNRLVLSLKYMAHNTPARREHKTKP